MKPSYSFVWSCLFSLSISLHAASPVVISEFMASNRSSNLLNQVFEGSAMSLVMQALSVKRATPEELRRLRRLLDEMEGDQS